MTIRCAVLVVATDAEPVSDEMVDGVRSLLGQNVPALFFVEERRVASERHLIGEILRRWCDEEDMDFVLTIGGTFPAPGHSGEQITPEATAAVLERAMPSLPEAMRAYAATEEAEALLDRGVAGIRTRTLIVNLPAAERLALLFAEAIGDLIEPIVVRLQAVPEAVDSAPYKAQRSPAERGGLDADEFAAFLAARRGEDSSSA
ncbi:MAG: hypothetical protein HY328_00745 [Chloroflexi bacterium]|nr:hypothetical protein [Chloroflexota bacterium]